MNGKGRALDNVFVERLWRAVKYEEIYLKDYAEVAECRKGLATYFPFYNHERPHMHLEYRTPWEVYRGEAAEGACFHRFRSSSSRVGHQPPQNRDFPPTQYA
jgi:putative transposase